MEKPDNQTLVIFGASGDLAGRKLLPSLFELFVRKLLPEKFVIIGAARTAFTDENYRIQQRENILKYRKGKTGGEADLDQFLQSVYYVELPSHDCPAYIRLKDKIADLQRINDIPDNVIYYLATPPMMYELIPRCLQNSGLNISDRGGWRRIIIEKPFGTDLASAEHLSSSLRSIFKESEIYRIDHYLGKETVQNILVLRFSNGIFEPLWNRNYIDYIEIHATETLGVENRGKYYEGSGAMRDMIQNHLMQLMAFVAMEPPATFDAEPIRDEIVKVFKSLHPFSGEATRNNVIRAQYAAGMSAGEPLVAYRAERDVAPQSTTETYVAMKFFIDNWRWGGVPFYLYTGKRMAEKRSEIVIHFKSTPQQMFVGQCSGRSCNTLSIKIQPDESISLKFGLKMPGAGFEVKQVSMDFNYNSLSKSYLPDAYERLLLDAMLGDSTLYSRSDALEESWRFLAPILKQWKDNPNEGLLFYNAGTGGPEEVLFSPAFNTETVCEL